MKIVFLNEFGFKKYSDVRLMPLTSDPQQVGSGLELHCPRVLVELVPGFNEEGVCFEFVGQSERVVTMDDINPLVDGKLFQMVAAGQWEWVKFVLVTGLTKFQPTLQEIYSWMYDLQETFSFDGNLGDPEYDDQGGSLISDDGREWKPIKHDQTTDWWDDEPYPGAYALDDRMSQKE